MYNIINVFSSQKNIQSNIYYDLESGDSAIKNTFEPARQKDESITLDDVQTWMKQQPNKKRKAYRDNNS